MSEKTDEELQAERDAIDAKLAARKLERRAEAVALIRAKMAALDISLSELNGVVKSRATGGKVRGDAPLLGRKVAAKYADSAGNSWSGRGVTPVWLRDAIAAGADREQFRIGGAA